MHARNAIDTPNARIAGLAITTLIGALVALPSAAQERWSVEVQGGGAFPTADVGEDELNTGFGFEGTVGVRLLDHLWGYAGWDWHRLSAERSALVFDLGEIDYEETGYAFGLRFEHPFSGESPTGPAYRLRAGGTYNHIEVEDTDGDPIADSDHALGWEIGIGATLPVVGRWRLSPDLRYRFHSQELGDTETEMDLQYLALELGVIARF